MPEANPGYLPIPQYYKREFNQFNAPNIRAKPKSN